jgi:hypothetical protein
MKKGGLSATLEGLPQKRSNYFLCRFRRRRFFLLWRLIFAFRFFLTLDMAFSLFVKGGGTR